MATEAGRRNCALLGGLDKLRHPANFPGGAPILQTAPFPGIGTRRTGLSLFWGTYNTNHSVALGVDAKEQS